MPRWLKGTIALLLLSVLFNGVDWHDDIPERLSRFSAAMVVTVLLAVLVQLLASAWRWWCSLRLHEIRLPFGFVLRVFCIGFYFNNFLPSAIGGDGYRIYRTLPYSPDKLRAVSAVAIERVAGLIVMLALGFFAALRLYESDLLAQTLVLLGGAGALMAAAGLAALHYGWFKRAVTKLRQYSWFKAVESSSGIAFRWQRDWIGLLAASAVFQILAAVILFNLFRGVGVEVDLSRCMLIAAASGLASILPISINGIGVVEGSIAGMAVALGIPYEPALIAAVALRILVLPANAICGLIYFLEKPTRAELHSTGLKSREG